MALIDRVPFLGKEAVDAKLVDGLAYRDEVYDQLKKKAGDRAEFLYLNQYLDRAGRPHQTGTTVALVYGVGGGSRGKSGCDPVQVSRRMAPDTVARGRRG